MAQSYSVTAVLSAVDKNFTSAMGKAQSALGGMQNMLGSGLSFGVFTGIGQKAFATLTSAASGLASELESTSAAWQTFEKNAEMNGHTAKEIAATKKELQSFAQQTVYSASDMATTYAQLDAVGIDAADSLVKGFGGIAAAAENPTQAMKTLSQQGVQMAAKPKVAWQDFKLMLEQTPAGISAVAKEMGMTTSELVSAVQEGEVKTDAFFKAVEKVGTSEAFTKLATTYKTAGQAMDGLSETVTNKLMPAFDVLQSHGIKVIESVIDKIDSFDGQKFADEISNIFTAFETGGVAGALSEITGQLDKLPDSVKGVAAAFGGMLVLKGGGLSVLSSLPGVFAGIESAGAGAFSTLSAKAHAAMSKISSLRIDPGKIAGSLDGLGGAIAGKLEAISPQLSDAGLKIWEGFEQAGAKVKSATGAIGKGFDFIVQKAGPVGQVFSGVGKGIKTSANVGVKSLSYMTSALGTVMKVALAAVGPAAILGLALAGMGLVYGQFGDQIDSIISMVKTRGPDIIGGLVRGITSRIPALAASGARMLSGIMGAITANIPAIFQGGVSIISTLAGAVTANLPVLIPAAVRMVTTLINSIVSSIPRILMTGLQLLLGLAQGLTNNSGLITSSATGIINNLVTSFTGNLPQILQTGVQILMALAQGAVNTLPQLIIAGIQGITMFISSVSQNLPMILQAGVSIVQTLLSGLVQNLPGILQAAVEMISALAQGILTNLPQIIIAGAQIIVSLVTGLIQMLPTILQAGWNLIVSLGQGIVEAVPQIITAAVEGIKGIFTDLWSFITGKNTEGNEAMTASTAATTANVSATYAGMSSTVTADTESMTSDLMKEYSKVESGASSAFSGMESSVTGSTSAIESAGTGDFSALQAGVTSASEGMQNSVDASMKQMTSSARSGMSGFNSALSSGSTRARATAQQMAKGVVTAAKSAASGMKSAGSSAAQGFVNGVSSKRSAASGAGSSVASAATNAMSGRSGTAYSHGANIGQGLANGIWSKVGAVRAAADALMVQCNRVIEARARLGSPSKVTTQYGKWYGEGWINGINDMVGDARKAAAKLFSVPEAKVPAVGFAGSGALSSEYDYSGSIHTTTVVTVDLDGREIARTTVPYTEELLDKREKRANRKKGVA